MPRKQPFNTVQGAAKTMKALSSALEPTEDLSREERAHFDRIVKSREAGTWQPHDLSIACQLAKSMHRLTRITDRLDNEGETLTNDRGTLVAHPLLSASMTLSGQIQALTRTLGLGASQRALNTGVQRKRNEADAKARKVIERAAKEDLLA